MADRYVGAFEATLRDDEGGRISTLIWGDPAHVLSTSGSRSEVIARGRRGWLETSELSDDSLLEIYVIDVGQGDGVLLKMPEGSWHLVDGGTRAERQMTKKTAANFVRWKFIQDLRMDRVSLDSIVVTHGDLDHYGGLIDLLSGRLYDGRRFDIEVGTLYHSGLGRFLDPDLGERVPGEVPPFPQPPRGIRREDTFHVELLDDRDSFVDPPHQFQTNFGEYAALVATVPDRAQRLSHRDEFLPGFEPGERAVTVRVLGPVLEDIGEGRVGLRRTGDEGETLNGHSVVLRLDYGQARILLTGDLNEESQRLLLSYHPEGEFAADVAKACHHGAEEVNLDFLRAMQARVTVVSSGDNESYSHPRPLVLGASARYGRESLDHEDTRVPPLVYSTELARSVELAFASAVQLEEDGAEPIPPQEVEVQLPGEGARFEPLERKPISSDLIYGLVNVRTDGTHVLCATLEESGDDFDLKVIRAGVDPD
jgi:beta-lactamase superfamily II metal-dependent hydrolase